MKEVKDQTQRDFQRSRYKPWKNLPSLAIIILT